VEDLKEITKTTVYGLAEMISTGINRSILNEYSQSPYYTKALNIVSEDLALDLGSSAL